MSSQQSSTSKEGNPRQPRFTMLPGSLGKEPVVIAVVLLGSLGLATEVPLSWAGLLVGAAGAAAAMLCVRRSGSRQRHLRLSWRLLGACLLFESAWLAGGTVRSSFWNSPDAAAGIVPVPDGSFAGLGMVLGGYLFALLWRDAHRSVRVSSRTLADLALVALGLWMVSISVFNLRAVCDRYAWGDWVPGLVVAIVTAAPALFLLGCHRGGDGGPGSRSGRLAGCSGAGKRGRAHAVLLDTVV
jgi:hypothetical protein